MRVMIEQLAPDLGRTRHELREDIHELRVDLRHVENRLFQTQLAVLATLATTIGALVAALVA